MKVAQRFRSAPGAALLLTLLLLTGCGGEPAADEADLVSVDDETYEQTASERTFADVDLTPVEWEVNPAVLHPGRLRVYDEGIYVVDYGTHRIRVFDWNGRETSVIAEGEGEGPGEFQNVSDFFVRGDSLWILDGQHQQISVFHQVDGFERRFVITARPFSFAPMGEHLAVQRLAPDTLFARVDATGAEVGTFGGLMAEHELKNPLAFQGEFAVWEEMLLFGLRDASYLYYFDDEGHRVRTVRTIDGLDVDGPDPENRLIRGPERPPLQYSEHVVHDDTLTMHTRDRENERSIIDVYTPDGAYVESIELPEHVGQAIAHGDRIVTQRDTALTKYRIDR